MVAVSSSKIVRIDGYELACRLPEPMGNSLGFFDTRTALLVAVTTAGGVTGWGETWAYPAAAAAMIRGQYGPPLLGRDAAAPRALHHAMLKQLGIDRHGVSHMAISALDIAVWDAAARTLGIPLHAALGGAMRERIPAYSSGPFLKSNGDPYRDFIAEIDGYLKDGFRAIKLRIGTTPAKDEALVRRVRERIGPDTMLMADLNQGFSVRNAVDLAHRLAALDLLWLEEPVVYDNLPGYRRLARDLPVPLAGGESLVGVGGFRDFITAEVFDLIQPDLALCGGITEGLKLAALAETFDVPVVPHVWGTVINFHAALHFAATLPERRGHRWPCPIFEYDYSRHPLQTICGEIPIDKDGHVAVPSGPGLGIDITPERFASLVVNRWTLQ